MKISSVKQYCDFMLEEGDNWIYRGQQDNYPLLPSIAREPFNNLPLSDFESMLVYEFSKRAMRFKNFPGLIIETLIWGKSGVNFI